MQSLRRFKVRNTNYVLFGVWLLGAALVALSIIPGLDFLAWHLLQPTGFWQRIILLGLEAITGFPRFLLASFLFLTIAGLAAEVSD